MPWTRSLVVGSDENGHDESQSEFSVLLPTGLDNLLRGVGHGVAGDEGEARFRPASSCRPATLLPSSRTTSGSFKPVSFTAATMPVAMTLQSMMPPKMFTRMPFTFGSLRMILNAAVTCSLLAPPPTSRKFAGLAAVMLDDVHRGHGEAGAVDEAGDVAVELDVIQVELAGLDFQRRFLGQVAHRLDVLVAVERVVIEADLGVDGARALPCRPRRRRCRAD